MYLGVFSVLFQGLPLAATLDKVCALGLDCIEIGTGAYPGNHHCDLDGLLSAPEQIPIYRRQVESAGLFISALSCQGNPLHPDPRVANEHHITFEKTVLLAERLEVPVINLLSGCPATRLLRVIPTGATSHGRPSTRSCGPGSGTRSPSLIGNGPQPSPKPTVSAGSRSKCTPVSLSIIR